MDDIHTGPSHVRRKIVSTFKQELSTSMNKVQIHLPNDVAAPENNFKPRPPLHATGGRASASRLRSNYKENNDTETGTKCFTQVFDAAKLLGSTNNNNHRNDSTTAKTKKKRIQSAKPRLITDKNAGLIDETLSVLSKPKSRRPVSAVAEGSLNKQKSWRPVSATTGWAPLRPFSASSIKHSQSGSDVVDDSENTPVIVIEPCVFGYKSGTFLSGKHSEEDAKPEGYKSVIRQNSVSSSVTRQTSASSSLNRQNSASSKTRLRNVRQFLEDDDISLTDLLDFDDAEEEVDPPTQEVPQTLQPLLPWQTQNVPREVIGIDPQLCLVFLPCLATQVEQLPCVPAPQMADEDLAFFHKILETPPPEKPQKMKKYEHPWTKLKIDEHVCQHHVHRSYGNNINSEEPPLSDRQIKIYGKDGALIHQSYSGQRTEDVVRKEIQELEDLMKGIGTENGCSLVVQYQADINRLQNMVDATMGRVEEIEMREAEKRRLLEPVDHFGLRKFYKDHDKLLDEIREQHAQCVAELSTLTDDLDLHSARRHFDERLASMEGQDNVEKNSCH